MWPWATVDELTQSRKLPTKVGFFLLFFYELVHTQLELGVLHSVQVLHHGLY